MTVKERFLKYVAFPTMSDDTSETTPSTKKQLDLAEYLLSELRSLGLSDARVDSHGYVYASLESNVDHPTETIGLIAHMDTSSEAQDFDIKPKTVVYDGSDIILNEELGIYLSASDYPELSSFKGQSLIVTDGTTLLGADDKAGIAEIITTLERIIKEGKPHGRIAVAFTPDEEIGRGADFFDVEGFGADYAYTVDGGVLGELEYENFNAASANLTFHGRAIHTGSAKGKMINAARIAAEFNGLLPTDEIPERTEGYEGFQHLLSISGTTELAESSYLIRDHDMKKFLKKKEIFEKITKDLNSKYGEGVVVLDLKDSYYNMREMIEPHFHVVERAKEAMRKHGVEPIISPIRGGTDGARLSYLGLPCPNLSTGGANFHSRYEFVSVDAMVKMTDILVTLVCCCEEQ